MNIISAWQATETLSYVNQYIYTDIQSSLHYKNKIHVLTSIKKII